VGGRQGVETLHVAGGWGGWGDRGWRRCTRWVGGEIRGGDTAPGGWVGWVGR